jgi:hypothetical protein
MKNLLILSLVSLFIICSCASKKDAKFRQETTPKFSNSRDYEQKPVDLRPLVEAILNQRIKASDPAVDTSIKAEPGNTIATGWVYGVSKDKYLIYEFNSKPKRVPLHVRRKLAFSLAGSVAGSLVTVSVTEEIEDLDKKTGSLKGWKPVDPDRELYQELFAELDLAVRSR